VTGDPIFAVGERRFFSLNWALQRLRLCGLTGFSVRNWDRDIHWICSYAVGKVALVTTRDAELYVQKHRFTLVNVDGEKIS